MASELSIDAASDEIDLVTDEIRSSVIIEEEFLETVLVGLFSQGTSSSRTSPDGKTLTANSFAEALGLSFSRIQFTPDLLPNDVTGTYIYNEQQGEFEFNEGPIFANVILADEDQPRATEEPGRAAGGDGRGPGHHRR